MPFYLFPGKMYERAQAASKFLKRHPPENLFESYKLYKLCTHQYLGFGAILQIFPGTHANKARQQLADALEPALGHLKATLHTQLISEEGAFKDKNPPQRDLAYKASNTAHRWRLGSYFNLSILPSMLSDVINGFNMHQPQEVKVIAVNFPILNNILTFNSNLTDLGVSVKLHPNALRNVIHSILNPVRIIDSALHFLHLVVNKFLSYIPFIGGPLNWIVDKLFGLVNIPVAIAMHVLNIPAVFILDILVHLGGTFVAAIENIGKEVLVAPISDIQGAKELRQAAKERDQSYTRISKTIAHSRDYIGNTKQEVYSALTDEKRVVAIRGPKVQPSVEDISIREEGNNAERAEPSMKEGNVPQTKKLITIFHTPDISRHQQIAMAKEALGIENRM